MHRAKPSEYRADNEAEWDAALRRLRGDLLQSWRWGTFKQRQGWTVARLRVAGPDGEAMAQVLIRRRGPMSLAYLPRGPVIAGGEQVASALLTAIDDACAQHRAVALVVEPDRPLPPAWTGQRGTFARGPVSFQTSRTVKVPLLDDAELLAQMRKDTRANVLHAGRRGVLIEPAVVEPSAIRAFYGLLRETSHRKSFGVHDFSYYEDFLRVFGDQAILLFSWVDGAVTAGLIAARSGVEGRSMYAGSATANRARGDAARARGDTALLRFEAMRWARGHGCTRFDLGGIASVSSPAAMTGDDGDEDRRGPDLDGVQQFKVGFGGEIIVYPPTVECRYYPPVAWLFRLFYPRFRTAPELL